MIAFGIKHRILQLRKCNFSYCDESLDLFDPSDPGGVWDNDLSDPYARTRANELVELAWTQPGENWKDETLDGKPFELTEPPEHKVCDINASKPPKSAPHS